MLDTRTKPPPRFRQQFPSAYPKIEAAVKAKLEIGSTCSDASWQDEFALRPQVQRDEGYCLVARTNRYAGLRYERTPAVKVCALCDKHVSLKRLAGNLERQRIHLAPRGPLFWTQLLIHRLGFITPCQLDNIATDAAICKALFW